MIWLHASVFAFILLTRSLCSFSNVYIHMSGELFSHYFFVFSVPPFLPFWCSHYMRLGVFVGVSYWSEAIHFPFFFPLCSSGCTNTQFILSFAFFLLPHPISCWLSVMSFSILTNPQIPICFYFVFFSLFSLCVLLVSSHSPELVYAGWLEDWWRWELGPGIGSFCCLVVFLGPDPWVLFSPFTKPCFIFSCLCTCLVTGLFSFSDVCSPGVWDSDGRCPEATALVMDTLTLGSSGSNRLLLTIS